MNCDGEGPHSQGDETRGLPIGEDSNAILCFACYTQEIRFRQDENTRLRDEVYDIPPWESLKVYGEPSTV